jgi:hypothetical protein
MKLGEALRLRSDNYKKIEELRARAMASAQMQDGQEIPDDPKGLHKRLDELSCDHRLLEVVIQEANWSTELAD